jgi:rubrerythrin
MLAALLFIAAGCSKETEAPPVPTATIENLKVAHACAFKRSVWYASAALEAERERMGNLAAMLRAISRSEAIHAANHERLLASKNATTDTSKAACLPLGSTRQALKMAQSLERTQIEGLYPPMVSTAVKEGWPEAAEQLRQAGLVDADHMAFMKEAADRNGTVPMRSYRVCSACGHIDVGSDTTCAICQATTFETL